MEHEDLRPRLTALIKSGCRIKLLGDSLTIGSGSSDSDLSGRVIYPPFRRQRGRRCWASLLEAHVAQYGCTVDNVGCYGTTSDEMMEHWDILYKPEEDRLVFCMIGTNDKKVTDGMAHLEANLRRVCDRVLGDGNQLILMTPNPATPANDAKPNRLFPQARVAQVIRTVAGDYAGRVLLIDHFAAMEKECQRLGCALEEFLEVGSGPENDGLHPGDRAYRFYFEHICRVLHI